VVIGELARKNSFINVNDVIGIIEVGFGVLLQDFFNLLVA